MKNFSKILGIIALAVVIGVSMVSCSNGGDNGSFFLPPPPDPAVTPIEEAFTNMLNDSFTFGGGSVTVNAITKMSNWGQTNSEYAVNSTNGSINYLLRNSFLLPSSFGTVPLISGGAVLMTRPDASIVWKTATGDTSYITGNIFGGNFSISRGEKAKTVTYPYTVTYPSGSNTQIIKGNLKLNLSKW